MRFVERAIAAAGLGPILEARRAGNMDVVLESLASWRTKDLLILGAIADSTRAADVGDVVRIHVADDVASPAEVLWIPPAETDLETLREVAVARIRSPREVLVGVDWSALGMELAQVALGFGASELRGTIVKKNGLPILPSDARKVKGAKLEDLATIKKREIAALVRHAGRVPSFTDERPEESGSRLAIPEDIRVRLNP